MGSQALQRLWSAIQIQVRHRKIIMWQYFSKADVHDLYLRKKLRDITPHLNNIAESETVSRSVLLNSLRPHGL